VGIGGAFAVGAAALLANFPGHPKTLLALTGLALALGVRLVAGAVAYIGARTYRLGGWRPAALALASYVVIIIVGPSSLFLLSPDRLANALTLLTPIQWVAAVLLYGLTVTFAGYAASRLFSR
jgi:hypothetical protein